MTGCVRWFGADLGCVGFGTSELGAVQRYGAKRRKIVDAWVAGTKVVLRVCA